jgi:hypothetical protein
MSQSFTIAKPNFFNGQRLTADEFKLNQEYHTSMRRRQNYLLHSHGIVEGLGLTDVTSAGGSPTIRVGKGMALAYFHLPGG